MFSTPMLRQALAHAARRLPPAVTDTQRTALEQVRAGRLLDATATLQRGLGRAPTPGGRHEPTTGRPAASGGTVLRGTFRAGAGERSYRVYLPSRPARPAPMLVMLHGGTQDADSFAAATGMDEIAEREGFLVVYPEQSRSANPMRYWNWFRPGDQRRDAGEPSLVAGITRAVAAEHGVDPGAVAVAGFSAGAAMAAVMAATHPDLYAAAGVHSGLAYSAAHDVGSAFAAMRGAVHGGGSGPSTRVPLIVIHGDHDETVSAANAARVVASAVGDRPATSAESGTAPGGRSWTRRRWTAPDGRRLVESWTVHGAGHAWSGGRAGGSYTDPAGPDAGAAIAAFCGFLRPAPR